MFTREAAITLIQAFIAAIKQKGYTPYRAVLFGSYAKGTPDKYSDIDLALWDEHFTGIGWEDCRNIGQELVQFHPIELHTFNSKKDTAFYHEVIAKEGVEIALA